MRGGSAIVAPGGDCPYLAGPLWEEEGILKATLDLNEVVKAKHGLDVTGHYARPDVFQLHVNRREQRPLVPFDHDPHHERYGRDGAGEGAPLVTGDGTS